MLGWEFWSLAIIIGLPICVLVLSEIHLRLRRRDSPLAAPLNRIRVLLLPLVALLLLLTQAAEVPAENNGVRIVATFVGIGVVTSTLAVLNAILFGQARPGTWRERLPSIFVDLGRLILIVAGAAIVASAVWGFDVGGLFAALGVGSIVIGLALQGAIGSVVSGLLLLFEQPFTIGDTLTVGTVTGRVVEMNWRSTHINTGSGVQIIPNATIAAASFTNLSRPTSAHDQIVSSKFAATDHPHQVMTTLLAVARDIPNLRPDTAPTVRMTGDGLYQTTLPLQTASVAAAAESQFLTWLWYAARRDELDLGGVPFVQLPQSEVAEALRTMTTTLGLTESDIEEISAVSEIEEYGQGEHIKRIGVVPPRLGYVLEGYVRVTTLTSDGAEIDVATYDRGEILGVSGVLREPSLVSCVAAGVVQVLHIPYDAVDRLVARRPAVARRLNQLVSTREEQRQEALRTTDLPSSAGEAQTIDEGVGARLAGLARLI